MQASGIADFGGDWRGDGRSHRSRQDRHIALRLGLRQIDGLHEHVAAQLVAERADNGPYRDVAELRERAGLSPPHIERLASADAFTSLNLPRRQALVGCKEPYCRA